ncbi:carboxypeptidase-like regulatory domain-containing protein [Flavobacterium agrisoli]|uniref:Carboxypeptidase-like regulatory domain-containing protein n=1 Tax=Flavobacterium agrisoli TaxID=2793066 RepID=A0A934UJY4_9FLAO|nr:carboxypeptidase-like regulatory domain-containing protein [Flavobacterium agrisoli]MBK0369900.1 carboxypeptidase-like regulatory domain-containing protein [Flavobacterium agrisoli]
MTPTEKGMYCLNCKKEVLDFTGFSNQKLAKKINQNKNICGRFLPSQINTELNYKKTNQFQKIGILFGLSSLFLTSPLFAQPKTVNIEIVEKKHTEELTKQNNYIEIYGIVTDEAGPLPGANVSQSNSNNHTSTDINGNFIIKIPIQDFDNKVFLKFQFIGLKEIEQQVFKKQEKLNIKLNTDDALIGEVVIVKKQNIFRRIGNLFK